MTPDETEAFKQTLAGWSTQLDSLIADIAELKATAAFLLTDLSFITHGWRRPDGRIEWFLGTSEPEPEPGCTLVQRIWTASVASEVQS